MKIVSDTSPICYLLLLGHGGLLPALFGRVLIPRAVAEELGHPEAPPVLQTWIANPPDWLEIAEARWIPSVDLDRLDPGEREAITLAEDVQADLVILDEKRARRAAQARGLEVMGLLGILGQAAEEGLISLPDTIDRLRKTSFRAEPKLLKRLLERQGPGREEE